MVVGDGGVRSPGTVKQGDLYETEREFEGARASEAPVIQESERP